MGKKNGRKREREDDEDAENKEVDDELEAELLALQEIQNERNQSDALTPSTTPTGHQNYNKEGLLHCIESLNVNKLPFIESMAICEYDLHLQDEKDDLEREVQTFLPFFHFISHHFLIILSLLLSILS